MKKNFHWPVILLCIFFSGCQTLTEKIEELTGSTSVPPESPVAIETSSFKKRILVLRFLNKTSYESEALQEPIFSEFRSASLKTPDVLILSENEIDKGENILGDESGYHFRTIFDVARAHGFSAVITGSIEDLTLERRSDEIGLFPTYEYALSAKVSFQLYETATERELASQTASADLSQQFIKVTDGREINADDTHRLQDAVAQATRKAVTHFPFFARRVAWGGQIVKVDRHRYYINAGEETGLTKGQLLKVLGESSPVIDGKTKVNLGMASGPFKGLLKIVDYLGRDAAIAVVHSGGNFRERDRVEVYTPLP